VTLPAGFGDLDWSDWIRGLVSAVVSGGAGAVSAAFVTAAQDPAKMGIGSLNSIELMFSIFFVTGLFNMFAFLRTKPIPDVKTVVTTVRKVEVAGNPPATTTTTVQETHEELKG
jgi:hypothetical protein